eukprot:TRINITY_DN22067_c4_g3_i1.p1 TRINITY_DN22067_c4_g3~~TRINITY_DN22067_c4_g3_i1.p1  ORF type:complete len:1877 (-),score=416.06 TRINITY_DN22067_c4_g3_i1:175-5805(-)
MRRRTSSWWLPLAPVAAACLLVRCDGLRLASEDAESIELEESSSAAQDCDLYMSSTGCFWTGDFSCPDQPSGRKGPAMDDGSKGYGCCCNHGLWRKAAGVSGWSPPPPAASLTAAASSMLQDTSSSSAGAARHTSAASSSSSKAAISLDSGTSGATSERALGRDSSGSRGLLREADQFPNLMRRQGCHAGADAGCEDVPYDCREGLEHWEASWSVAKAQWCCIQMHIGCTDMHTDRSAPWATPSVSSTPVDGTLRKTSLMEQQELESAVHNNTAHNTHHEHHKSVTFDCDEGLDMADLGWSDFKKEYCCLHEKKGCKDTSRQAHSREHRRHHGHHHALLSEKATLEEMQKKLEQESPNDPFDCQQGINAWEAQWSVAKRDWCCKNRRMGCSVDAAKAEDSGLLRHLHSGAGVLLEGSASISSSGSSGSSNSNAAAGTGASSVAQAAYEAGLRDAQAALTTAQGLWQPALPTPVVDDQTSSDFAAGRLFADSLGLQALDGAAAAGGGDLGALGALGGFGGVLPLGDGEAMGWESADTADAAGLFGSFLEVNGSSERRSASASAPRRQQRQALRPPAAQRPGAQEAQPLSLLQIDQQGGKSASPQPASLLGVAEKEAHLSESATASGEQAESSSTAEFDCGGGLDRGFAGWSPLKQRWCCERWGIGCGGEDIPPPLPPLQRAAIDGGPMALPGDPFPPVALRPPPPLVTPPVLPRRAVDAQFMENLDAAAAASAESQRLLGTLSHSVDTAVKLVDVADATLVAADHTVRLAGDVSRVAAYFDYDYGAADTVSGVHLAVVASELRGPPADYDYAPVDAVMPAGRPLPLQPRLSPVVGAVNVAGAPQLVEVNQSVHHRDGHVDYDCVGLMKSWDDWSPGQKAWCCEMRGLGCDLRHGSPLGTKDQAAPVSPALMEAEAAQELGSGSKAYVVYYAVDYDYLPEYFAYEDTHLGDYHDYFVFDHDYFNHDEAHEPHHDQHDHGCPTTLVSDAARGSLKLDVEQQSCFAVGDLILIGDETNYVKGFGSVVLESPLNKPRPAGTIVSVVQDGRAYDYLFDDFVPIAAAPMVVNQGVPAVTVHQQAPAAVPAANALLNTKSDDYDDAATVEPDAMAPPADLAGDVHPVSDVDHASGIVTAIDPGYGAAAADGFAAMAYDYLDPVVGDVASRDLPAQHLVVVHHHDEDYYYGNPLGFVGSPGGGMPGVERLGGYGDYGYSPGAPLAMDNPARLPMRPPIGDIVPPGGRAFEAVGGDVGPAAYERFHGDPDVAFVGPGPPRDIPGYGYGGDAGFAGAYPLPPDPAMGVDGIGPAVRVAPAAGWDASGLPGPGFAAAPAAVDGAYRFQAPGLADARYHYDYDYFGWPPTAHGGVDQLIQGGMPLQHALRAEEVHADRGGGSREEPGHEGHGHLPYRDMHHGHDDPPPDAHLPDPHAPYGPRVGFSLLDLSEERANKADVQGAGLDVANEKTNESDEQTAGAVAGTNETTSEPYDCDPGPEKGGVRNWPSKQRHWCCEQKHIGCLAFEDMSTDNFYKATVANYMGRYHGDDDAQDDAKEASLLNDDDDYDYYYYYDDDPEDVKGTEAPRKHHRHGKRHARGHADRLYGLPLAGDLMHADDHLMHPDDPFDCRNDVASFDELSLMDKAVGRRMAVRRTSSFRRPGFPRPAVRLPAYRRFSLMQQATNASVNASDETLGPYVYWSYEKRWWCCEHYGIACVDPIPSTGKGRKKESKEDKLKLVQAITGALVAKMQAPHRGDDDEDDDKGDDDDDDDDDDEDDDSSQKVPSTTPPPATPEEPTTDTTTVMPPIVIVLAATTTTLPPIAPTPLPVPGVEPTPAPTAPTPHPTLAPTPLVTPLEEDFDPRRPPPSPAPTMPAGPVDNLPEVPMP